MCEMNKCFCFTQYFIREQQILAFINNDITINKNANEI